MTWSAKQEQKTVKKDNNMSKKKHKRSESEWIAMPLLSSYRSTKTFHFSTGLDDKEQLAQQEQQHGEGEQNETEKKTAGS